MAQSDMLEFGHGQIRQAISTMIDIKSEVEVLMKKYLDYVNDTLSPAWRTSNGQITLNKLRNFADEDIQSFINYLKLNIDNLEQVAVDAQKIDVA